MELVYWQRINLFNTLSDAMNQASNTTTPPDPQ